MPTVSPEEFATYQDALLRGDRRTCEAVARRLLDQGISVRALYLDLFQRALYRVGLLWERNQVSVATEHIATAITEGLLNLALPYILEEPRIGRTVVVAGIAPEMHQVGAKMVADTFEMAGWDSLYVGANTPKEEAVRLLEERSPDLLALSLTMVFNVGPLEAMVEAAQAACPGLQIVIGGQGLLRSGDDVAARRSVHHLRSLADLDGYLEE